MGTVADACKQDYDVLEAKAVATLNKAAEDLASWIELIRDPEMPWAFRWAVESTRGANVAATSYILGTAKSWGLTDRVLSAEQRKGGAEWIRSLEAPENTFSDPALLDRKPPAWNDDDEAWPPDGGGREALNQYSRGCLRNYDGVQTDNLAAPPPPTWPQKDDANVLDWIKKVEPNWSWIGRIIHRLINWYHEGAIPKERLLECMHYAHSRQDPETGFWGGGIATTFKLLITVHDPAELPVPRAEKIIDSVLRVMDEPNYDDALFPCEEFDAFYDLAIAWTTAPGYRRDEIRKLAAHRICYILDTHTQADRGLSSFPDRCVPTWLAWDMAPALPQGDVFGWAIYSAGFNICVDILGIADRVPQSGIWRQRDGYDTTPYIEVGKSLLIEAMAAEA